MYKTLQQYKRLEPINGFHEPHLRGFMRQLDYQEGAPSAEAAEIDEGVVKSLPCNECGYRHCKYLAFTKGKSYKAFSICLSPDCEYYEEF